MRRPALVALAFALAACSAEPDDPRVVILSPAQGHATNGSVAVIARAEGPAREVTLLVDGEPVAVAQGASRSGSGG